MNEIHQLLNRYPPDCRPTLIGPLGNAGGMSGAKFWRITAPCGTLILRRWPPKHPTPGRLGFIHAVIDHAALTVDFLPVPIKTHDGHSFIHAADHLWELAPWLPGVANYELAPSDEKLRATMTALAQFHNAVASFEPSPEIVAMLRLDGPPAIPRRLARLHGLIHREAEELEAAIRDIEWPEFARIARIFLACLPRALPHALAKLEPLAAVQLPRQPCIRDIWHDHVLFTENTVTGIVDFGAVDIDTPATDVARLLGSLAGEPSLPFREKPRDAPDRPEIWRQGLAAYSAERPLSNDEALAVNALNSANPILAGCNWIRWIYVERRRFEDPAKILTRFQRLAAQLST
jgi:homoserine kinase type II